MNRQQYLDCAELRKKTCPAFAHIPVRHDLAASRLPTDGVPDALLACSLHVPEAGDAQIKQEGPADHDSLFNSSPKLSDPSCDGVADAVDANDADEEGEKPAGDQQAQQQIVIASNTEHEEEPVRLFQAVQEKAQLLEEEVAKMKENEIRKRVAGLDGQFCAAQDTGGRFTCQSVYADMQTVLRKLGPGAKERIEAASLAALAVQSSSLEALAIPLNKPLSLYSPSTYPAAFVEWFYGDATPNLDRPRRMLIEELFAGLLDREELEYGVEGDERMYQASARNRFNAPEVIAVMNDVRRRLLQLQSVRLAFRGPNQRLSQDLQRILRTSPEDFLKATDKVSSGKRPEQFVQDPEVPEELKAVLRTISFLTARIPGTAGYCTATRHLGNAMNIRWGPCNLFMTGNYADSRCPLMLTLAGQAPALLSDEILMPSLQEMRRLFAKDGRAQAKFFLLQLELQHRHLQGLEDFHVGRHRFFSGKGLNREDDYASSLRPCIAGMSAAGLTPFESQARGFKHGHSKNDPVFAQDASWLRRLFAGPETDWAPRLDMWRQNVLRTACTVQYDSCSESARQFGVDADVPAEAFTAEQQVQSKYDGELEIDGSRRVHVPVTGPEQEKHVIRESALASAEQRQSLTQYTAPLTGSQLAALPSYRLLQNFGRVAQLDSCGKPVVEDDQVSPVADVMPLPFNTNAAGVVTAARMPDGMPANEADLAQDAKRWSLAFSKDVFSLQALTHTHNCKETCVKYVKDKTEAKQSLEKGRVPLCRFHMMRRLVFELKDSGNTVLKRVLRRGKQLVSEPYVSAEEDANMYGRPVPVRTHPFTTSSNDCALSCLRCNVDCQFVARTLPEALTVCDVNPQHADSQMDFSLDLSDDQTPVAAWMLPIAGRLNAFKRSFAKALQAMFRAAHCCDFYITKYQTKPQQTMTPLTEVFADTIHKIQREPVSEEVCESEQLPKKRKTVEASRRQAQSLLIKMTSALNRCHWHSIAEICGQIMTGAARLQTHSSYTIPMRKIVFMLSACKNNLNANAREAGAILDEEPEGAMEMGALHCSASGLPQTATSAGTQDEAQDSVLESEDPDITTSSEPMRWSVTYSLIDDWLHRGPLLKEFNLYTYAMYVKRCPQSTRDSIPFESHYTLSSSCSQQIRRKCVIPVISGFQYKSEQQDAETSSMIKAIMFSNISCRGPSYCACPSNFAGLLLPGKEKGHCKWLFRQYWKIRRCELDILARRADRKAEKASRVLVLRDTTLFKSWLPPEQANPEQHKATVVAIRGVLADVLESRGLPNSVLCRIPEFLCAVHIDQQECPTAEPDEPTCCIPAHAEYHVDQCHVEEFCAHVACNISLNIELTCEARSKPPTSQKPADIFVCEQEPAADVPAEPEAPYMDLEVMGAGDADQQDVDDVEDDAIQYFMCHPFERAQDVCNLALQKKKILEAGNAGRPSREQKMLREYASAYGDELFRPRPWKHVANLLATGSSEVSGLSFGQRSTIVLQEQAAWIKQQKKNLQNPVTVPNSGSRVLQKEPGCAEEPCRLVPADLRFQGPGAYAWKLLQEHGANEEQIDATALIVLPLQRRFHDRANKDELLCPNGQSRGNQVFVALGGGGCGKSFWMLKILKPIVETYFGPQSWAAQAPANQPARLIGGKTVHSSAGLLATSSLKAADLALKGDARKKQELHMENKACWALDEAGQCPGALLHAAALRATYARCRRFELDTSQYLTKPELFGRMPLVIASGDFLQLPPVPAASSLLAAGTKHLRYEHRQGKAVFQLADCVFEFKQSMRFTDQNLVHILETMRLEGGGQIRETAWEALLQTQVSDASDARLLAAMSWKEGAHEWTLVGLAQQANARLQAAAAGRILYYLPAVDNPDAYCPKQTYRAMSSVANLTTTGKLMSILPIFIGMRVRLLKYLTPDLGPESEGEVVGIELHPQEAPILARGVPRPSLQTDGFVVLQVLPKCVYVKFDGVQDEVLRPDPCKLHALCGPDRACPDCRFYPGVFAVRPQSAKWKFTDPDCKAHFVCATRYQLPLAPANQKTLHTLQGMTAEPGLKAHWTLPPRLAASVKWLAYYVMLSRPRSLSSLLSFGMPERRILEGGPPQEILESLRELFGDKLSKAREQSEAARRELSWPARL